MAALSDFKQTSPQLLTVIIYLQQCVASFCFEYKKKQTAAMLHAQCPAFYLLRCRYCFHLCCKLISTIKWFGGNTGALYLKKKGISKNGKVRLQWLAAYSVLPLHAMLRKQLFCRGGHISSETNAQTLQYLNHIKEYCTRDYLPSNDCYSRCIEHCH